MNSLLTSFCETVKEGSARWMREARMDPSVSREVGVVHRDIEPFLNNPQGVLAAQGRQVRSGLTLPAAGAHLQDAAKWPEALEALNTSSVSSEILHAHQNPHAALEKLTNPAWGREVTDAARTPLNTYRGFLKPTGPASTFPARVDLYKGLTKVVPKEQISGQPLLRSAWHGVIPPALPKFLESPPAPPPPTPLSLGQKLRGLFKKR